MPLTKRSISPVHISLHRLPPNVRENELECVANGTLANLVRQLSSLSRHAEDIFGELFREAVKIEHKTSILYNRIDRIALKVTQLDSNVEEVSLQDLHLRKPFKSSTLIDQQSLSRQTMPAAMTECYAHCDRPPELDKLNPYRTDGKAALKFYTDPDYFFELWRQEMLKDGDHPKRVKHVNRTKGEGKKRKSPRQPTDHRHMLYEKAMRTGEPIHLMPSDYQTAEAMRRQQQMANGRLSGGQLPPSSGGMPRPESLELQQAQQAVYDGSSGYGSMSSNMSQHPRVSVMNQPDYYQPPTSAAAASQQQRYQPGAAATYAQFNRTHPQNRDYDTGPYVTVLPPSSLTNSSHSAVSSSTPTMLQDANQMSPLSASSSDSSGQLRGGSRPAQPPPAPPPPPASSIGGPLRPAPPVPDSAPSTVLNGDLRQQFSRMQIIDTTASTVEILRTARTMSPPRNTATAAMLQQSSSLERSMSPELPPPPPPLYTGGDTFSSYMENRDSTPSGVHSGFNGGPPPPPPPPPPVANGFTGGKQEVGGGGGMTNSGSFQSSAKSTSSAAPKPMDARSDLLKAIREGIQLKKVDRKEEKEREEAATKGHDVAAILKRRMEDVMGRGSESEESADDYDDDDWDD